MAAAPPASIYLFDCATGALVRRIEGPPDVANHLVFSPGGQRLAATLGSGGLRIYARASGWAEIARDAHYGGKSFGASFAQDGLATTAHDGRVRLYTGALQGDVHPAREIGAPVGQQPYGIAFSPDGTRVAIGHANSTAVDVLDGHSLTARPGADLRGMDGGNLGSVAWSRDGRTLFAAGHRSDGAPVLAWSDAGAGARRVLPAGQNTVMSLVPLPEGDLLVASQDPWLGRLGPDGSARWVQGPPTADLRNQERTLSVSSDGTRIDFSFAPFGQQPARFDLPARTLRLSPPADGQTTPPRQTGVPIEGWAGTTRPTLLGHALALAPDETSRSLAVDPSGARFVLGAEWRLRAFDAMGTKLWQRPVPDIVWAVNITRDGRLVVAAYGDGTIRWHRMSDGAELLAFMPLVDRKNWVAWTPEGFYGATPGARGVLRWHVNRGWDTAADSVSIEDIPGFRHPEALPLVLQELETARALGLAVIAAQRRQFQLRTESRLPPGAVLHVLAIGISDYNAATAAHLRLRYAADDATTLAGALCESQDSLYAGVRPQLLRNAEAHRAGILGALESLRGNMAPGAGDLAVFFFSGHGELLGNTLYLLPHDVDARSEVGILDRGLSLHLLREELLAVARLGRVLVLLDACHAGALRLSAARPASGDALALALAEAEKITVLTACRGTEIAVEDDTWQHGAFTRALLDAFTEADSDRDGLIGPNELAHYLDQRVPELSEGRQHPGMEIRYGNTLFGAGV